jgi:glycosyltransferase involved in cell wall biosynthesis
VRAIDWVPSARRYDLLREVDVLCAPHRPSLETDLSLRTRYLDALAADCPVVATEGGTLGRLLTTHGAGRTVPPGDPKALAAALSAALSGDGGDASDEAFCRGRRSLVAEHAWERVLEPLVAFCRAPEKDPTADDFAFRPTTAAPPDSLGFRVRRRLRGLLGGHR